jgi:hypothetical protein
VFTTLFGTAQLALQDALRKNLDAASTTPRAPNFVIVSLRRESFVLEYEGELQNEITRFRRDLDAAMRSFISAHGWGIGGSGTVVIHILLRSMVEACEVQAEIARSFYELEIQDDRGKRTVPIGSNPAIIGRAHDPHPRGFVPLHDALRLVSREHLLLTYTDLHLRARVLGRNLTTLNGAPMGDAEIDVRNNDLIACGACSIRLMNLRGE